MNERIDELMIQAGARFEMMNWVHYDDFEYKKFAELIVKECAIIANRAENTETELRCMYDVITEHFGVEE